MKAAYFLTILLLSSCATINPLEGGDKDTAAPKVLNSKLDSINFNQKEIEFEFDEYIQLNDAEKNIKIYPEHSKIKCSINKKKLIIKFDTVLHSNTTYYLNINDGVKDVNEGNLFQLSKLFSTGPQIDSGYINLETLNPSGAKNIKVSILEGKPSDSLRNFKPYYTLNATRENLKFMGLKDKIYSIWAYTDQDQNNLPDWYSPIGFIEDIHTDTTVSIEIFEWNPILTITSAQTDGQYTKLKYKHNNLYYKLIPELYSTQLGNIIYANADSALFEDFKYEGSIDTCSSIDPYSEMHGMILKSMQAVEGNNFTIYYTLPQFYNDESNSLVPKQSKTEYIKRKDSIQIYVPRIEGMDTIDIASIISKEEIKLSKLTIQIQDSTERKFDIVLSKDGKIYEKLLDCKIYEKFIEPGTYTLEIFESETTSKLDPFNGIKPAGKKYSRTLILKASWEENLQIKIE